MATVAMPRPPRKLEEGRIYHVYNRVGGAEAPFEEEQLATRFVGVLREVVQRDDLTVFAWVLMGNHYHLVVRMKAVPLSRSMKTLQQKVTRFRNWKADVRGSLWQGRYKAIQVDEQDYLQKLVAYVHLNPVKAGLVNDTRGYRWSGHRDVLQMRQNPIVSIDDALLVYGETRKEALAAYRSALRQVSDSSWSREAPGKLPWWRLGRRAEDRQLQVHSNSMLDELGRSTAPYRPQLSAEEWVVIACGCLGVDRADLAGRGRQPEIVRARELTGLIGVERYGVQVKRLAEELGKSEDGVSLWVRRGARRRSDDAVFAGAAERLDSIAQQER